MWTRYVCIQPLIHRVRCPRHVRQNANLLSELLAEAIAYLDGQEAADLVATVRRGREKLHYLNPVPIHAVQTRWIAKFEQPRLDALAALKTRLEGGDDG